MWQCLGRTSQSKATMLSKMIIASAGFLSHVFYFVNGEHHLQGPLFVKLCLLTSLTYMMTDYYIRGFNFSLAFLRSFETIALFLGPLFISMLLYRTLFHSLTKFPGPFAARLTKFWHFARVARRSDNHRFLEELRKQYGDFVRTGEQNPPSVLL